MNNAKNIYVHLDLESGMPVVRTGGARYTGLMRRSDKEAFQRDLTYYGGHSPMTQPRACREAVLALPHDVLALCDAVQGLVIHVLHGKRYNVELPFERQALVQVYRASDMLDQLLQEDSRPLAEARSPEKRFVGTCRHFSVLLCCFLRTHRYSARVRNGFSAYLKPGVFSDHWVCEYWNPERDKWMTVDAQMDAVHRQVLNIPFDHLDVPHDEQVLAGEMWRRCCAGQEDPMRCGSMNLWGMDYVRGNLIRDVAALNKMEMLPWDGADLSEKPSDELTPGDFELLDCLADQTAPEVHGDALRAIFGMRPELHPRELPMKHTLPD